MIETDESGEIISAEFNPQYLHRALRLARAFSDLTQADVCRQAQVNSGWLSQVEDGKKIPSLTFIFKVCKVYGVSLGQLVTLSEQIERFGTAELLNVICRVQAEGDEEIEEVEGEEVNEDGCEFDTCL